MTVKNFALDSWLFSDERVILKANRISDTGEDSQIILVELTREEFLSFFAHLTVLEMNMKKIENTKY